MKIVVRNVAQITSKTNPSTGEVRRGRRVLCYYGDGATACWKYVSADVYPKLEEIKVGAEYEMYIDENGFPTVFEKIGG